MRDLSPREAQVLELIAADRSDREIAGALGISYQTVRGYVKTLYRKLAVHSRVGAFQAHTTWKTNNSEPSLTS